VRQFLILLALVILAPVVGAPGLADKQSSQTEASQAASPPSVPASAEKYLKWEKLNGPYERVTYALTAVSDDRDITLYAGTWGHGVYRSKDGGNVWKSRGSGGGMHIRALAALPSSSKTLYAGSFGEGLFRSADGGKHWEPLGSEGLLTQPSAQHIARNPLYIESMLILSEQGAERILVGSHYGVWASDDLGDKWQPLRTGFADTDNAYNIQALAHDPIGRLYAGTLDGLYGSRDGGQTWQFTGPPNARAGDTRRRILSLAVVTSTTNSTGTLLVGTQGAGLYALDIESGSWFTPTTGFSADKRAQTIQILLSAPDGVAYAGTVDFGVFETRDGGHIWQQRVEGLPSHARSVLSLTRIPIDGTLYAGTYGGGVYRLRPGSQQWEPANAGLPVDFPVQEIAFAGLDNQRLLAGLQVGGMYLNTTRQEPESTWKRLPQALPIGPARDVSGLAVSGANQDAVVIAAGTGIFRSTDAGETWHHLGDAEGLPPSNIFAIALAQGRQDPGVLYTVLAGGEGIYRSVDAGATWTPALGDLEAELADHISCLTVGHGDETVYLGLSSGQPYVTKDAGETWQPLSRISDEEILELDWGERTAWDQFLHGDQRRMLYARTTDGIYVSYDGGRAWHLRMRGFFSALLADPHRPWIVYLASPGTTLGREFAPPIALTPDLWISHDGGETWTWAGPGPPDPIDSSPASITTLAFDPNDTDQLYAGTEGAGVFCADLAPVIPRYRPYTLRAVALLLISILLLGGGTYVLQVGLTSGRPYRLPLYTWPSLAYLRARHTDEVGLVSDPHTPLTSLERLVLALVPSDPFRSDAMLQPLETFGTPVPLSQIETTLNRLALEYRLLDRREGRYRMTWPLLGQIARTRFWDAPKERGKLLEEVRGESQLRTDTRYFFAQAGFDVLSLETGFRVVSSQPEYALLSAERGIYVHLHTAKAVTKKHIEQVQDNATRTYERALAGKIAFLVVSGAPHVDAYQHIIRLWHEEDLHVVLLSHNSIRRAADKAASRQQLQRSLRRALGNRDLFRLDGPALDLLDFFDRETDPQREMNVEGLLSTCQEVQVVWLGGMPGIGKTSLAWQVMDHLPRAIVARMDLTDSPCTGLYAAVREGWLANARRRFPQWEQPYLPSLPEEPNSAQIEDDLTTILKSLRDQTSTELLAVVLDGLTDLACETEGMQALTQAVASAEGAILLGIFDTWPWHKTSLQVLSLRPFKEATCTRMIDSLAVQMELRFDPSTVQQLHLASGGHPLILRQLASLAIAQRGGSNDQIDVLDVERAVSKYVSQPNPTLSRIWNSLSTEEQQVLLSATEAEVPLSNHVLIRLQELGWLCSVDGRWQLFSQALARWLDVQVRPQQ
jgi:photosystem II stability/assembly factor-like uncharacterized protein